MKDSTRSMLRNAVSSDSYLDHAGNRVSVNSVTGRLRVQHVNDLPSRTDQSGADDVDVKKILEKYRASGVLGNIRSDAPSFGDFTSSLDFTSAQNAVARAKESFYALPSSTRNRFQNDPAQLLSFLESPENRSEAVKLGLVKAAEVSPDANPAPVLTTPEGDQ